ncbi:MAG: alkaline phosphatase family protein [Clostridiales Family XIII bacterium]|nr:alkaline phosphatase family protein [Clostridiales Family XIII bacterium]
MNNKNNPLNRKILVLGIDGMDAATTKRLLDDGKMPNLQQYLNQGAAREDLQMLGALPTITPPCWTTLATGAYPGTHGITCYWRQSPDSLDAVVYNMDSKNCKAEQIWNVTTEAGMKTLVWHWPGSSWPPTSDSPLLHVVDGTQPGSVNMGISQMDWEKIITADADIKKFDYTKHTEKAAGVGCNITDLYELIGGSDTAVSDQENIANDADTQRDLVHEKSDPHVTSAVILSTTSPSDDSSNNITNDNSDENSALGDDEMMELWWGDAARHGTEIRTYVYDLDDTEMMIGAKVAYDSIRSPLKSTDDWEGAPAEAFAFEFVTSAGELTRYGLILKSASGAYNLVRIYRSKSATSSELIVEIPLGRIVGATNNETKKDRIAPSYRLYKILSLDANGQNLRLWISNALDTTNDELWSPKQLLTQVTQQVGPVPPVSLIGGEDSALVDDVFLPSWALYNQWQADALKMLIKENEYEAVFTHLHNVDCAGHQVWHLAKTLEPWAHTDEATYQRVIEDVYVQTDDYLGEFLYLLDEDWTIFIVSDHGLLVGENVPPILGEYGGLNIGVMEELGYTVMKRDANGNKTGEVDWAQTTAIQIRSNHIYVNLKGRDAAGIVLPEEQYDLEERIISDLYGYRDQTTGKRVVGIALRNKDAVVLGANGPESGDIFFTIEEGFNRLHGDGLSTAAGYMDTSTMPVFIAAGEGISANVSTQRVIRQVDVTPTIASLLSLRYPKQCEGGVIHQILS